jgi:hypothetical protein
MEDEDAAGANKTDAASTTSVNQRMGLALDNSRAEALSS